MTKNVLCIPPDPKSMVAALQGEAVEMLAAAGGELVLDFSHVVRIDAAAARAMEELADRADQAAVRIQLLAVPIAVYRALKLLNLAPRFSFAG